MLLLLLPPPGLHSNATLLIKVSEISVVHLRTESLLCWVLWLWRCLELGRGREDSSNTGRSRLWVAGFVGDSQ